MFIVWGTKVVRKKIGRRAEFCRLCRRTSDRSGWWPSRASATSITSRSGVGRRIAIEETCEVCGLTVQGAFAGYPLVTGDRHADIETLIFDTNPEIRRGLADRLSFEARVRSNQLSPAEREDVLQDSFNVANLMLEGRPSMAFDLASGLGCLGTIAASMAVAYVALDLLRTSVDTAEGATLAVGGVLAVVTLILLVTGGGRHARRTILPPLARAGPDSDRPPMRSAAFSTSTSAKGEDRPLSPDGTDPRRPLLRDRRSMKLATAMIPLAALAIGVSLIVPMPLRGRAGNAILDLGHAPAFGLLAIMAMTAIRPRWRGSVGGLAAWVWVILVMLGGLAEAIQAMTGRHPSLHDAAANALGAAAGLVWAMRPRDPVDGRDPSQAGRDRGDGRPTLVAGPRRDRRCRLNRARCRSWPRFEVVMS